MKKVALILVVLVTICFGAIAQIDPILKIDADTIVFKSGLSLPYWLKAGQTVSIVSNINTISVLEFNADSNSNLKFSQVLSVKTQQTVPTGKAWKIEGLGMTKASAQSSGNSGTGSNVVDTTSLTKSYIASANTTKPTIFNSPKTYNTTGTYSWKVPPGVSQICVEVWGGGGNGGASYKDSLGGGSGGGGGYGYQCFSVVSGTVYTVIVGNSGQSSSFGSLISATGGTNGGNASVSGKGSAGIGGTSTATYNMTGNNGISGINSNGGNGANGGGGGGFTAASWNCYLYTIGDVGTLPGGGGGTGGQITYSSCGTPFLVSTPGGAGANGQVIIYW